MIKITMSIIGAFFCKTLGCFDNLLTTLTIIIVIDYLTGIIKAVINKQLSSEIGFKGISKKVLIFFMVALATQLDTLFENAGIRYIVISFYIINEGISIIENVEKLGIPIPSKIREILASLNEKNN